MNVVDVLAGAGRVLQRGQLLPNAGAWANRSAVAGTLGTVAAGLVTAAVGMGWVSAEQAAGFTPERVAFWSGLAATLLLAVQSFLGVATNPQAGVTPTPSEARTEDDWP